MNRLILRFTLIVLLVIYVFRQTLFLYDFRDIMQFLVILLMGVSILLIIGIHARAVRKLFSYRKTALSFGSILLFNLVFFDPFMFFVILFKVLFFISCSVLFFSQSGKKTFLMMADSITLSVVVIGILAQLGLIPTVVAYSAHWDKNSAGFNNANNAFYFLFTSFLVYFIFGSKSRMVGCLLIMFVFVSINSFSRTYLVGAVYIALISIFMKYRLLRKIMRPVLLFLILLFWSVGSGFYLVATFAPFILQPFVNSPLDILFSYRLSLSLEDIFMPATNLVGFTFGSKDSIYNELIFIFGPVFWIILFLGIYRWWVASKQNDNAFKIISVMSIISVTGLTESIFLTVTPITIILISIAFLTPGKASNIFKIESDRKFRRGILHE